MVLEKYQPSFEIKLNSSKTFINRDILKIPFVYGFSIFFLFHTYFLFYFPQNASQTLLNFLTFSTIIWVFGAITSVVYLGSSLYNQNEKNLLFIFLFPFIIAFAYFGSVIVWAILFTITGISAENYALGQLGTMILVLIFLMFIPRKRYEIKKSFTMNEENKTLVVSDKTVSFTIPIVMPIEMTFRKVDNKSKLSAIVLEVKTSGQPILLFNGIIKSDMYIIGLLNEFVNWLSDSADVQLKIIYSRGEYVEKNLWINPTSLQDYHEFVISKQKNASPKFYSKYYSVLDGPLPLINWSETPQDLVFHNSKVILGENSIFYRYRLGSTNLGIIRYISTFFVLFVLVAELIIVIFQVVYQNNFTSAYVFLFQVIIISNRLVRSLGNINIEFGDFLSIKRYWFRPPLHIDLDQILHVGLEGVETAIVGEQTHKIVYEGFFGYNIVLYTSDFRHSLSGTFRDMTTFNEFIWMLRHFQNLRAGISDKSLNPLQSVNKCDCTIENSPDTTPCLNCSHQFDNCDLCYLDGLRGELVIKFHCCNSLIHYHHALKWAQSISWCPICSQIDPNMSLHGMKYESQYQEGNLSILSLKFNKEINPAYTIFSDKELKITTLNENQQYQAYSLNGVSILQIPSSGNVENWIMTKNLDSFINNAAVVELDLTNEAEFKHNLTNLQRHDKQEIRDRAFLIYSAIISENSGQLTRKPMGKRLKSSVTKKLDLGYFVYVMLTSFILSILNRYIGDTDFVFNFQVFNIIIFLFFFFQIYQGLTIKQYGEEILQKLEKSQKTIQRFLPRLNWIFFEILKRIRTSFGMVIVTIWVISFVALSEINEELFTVPNLNYDFLEFFNKIILGIHNILDVFNFEVIFAEIVLFSVQFFSETIGIFLRLLGILTIFWAVYSRGWKILLVPYAIEDRSGRDKLDWYEALALPLGITVAIILLLIDNSSLRDYPTHFLLLGFFIGGILYLIFERRDRDQMILTSIFILLVTLFVISLNFESPNFLFHPDPIVYFGFFSLTFTIVLAFTIQVGRYYAGEDSKSSFNSNILQIIAGGIFLAGFFLIPFYGWFVTYGWPSDDYLIHRSNFLALAVAILLIWYTRIDNKEVYHKGSIQRILGMPNSVNNQPTRLWQKIASACRFRPTSIKLLNFDQENRQYFDFSSIMFIVLVWIVIPASIIRYSFFIHPLILMLLILSGLAFWIINFNRNK